MTFEKLKARRHKQALERRQEAAARKDALLTRAVPIFERYGIEKAVLFGSSLTASSPGSDIDLYLAPLAQQDYWACKHDLEEATNYPIDLYTQADDPTLVKKILARGEVIYP